MQFQRLELQEWRQFERIAIDFHERLTILTGANGSGKTALLRFLARHFGWGYLELNVPVAEEKTGRFVFRSIFRRRPRADAHRESGHIRADAHREIGHITYHGARRRIVLPQDAAPTYQPLVENSVQTQGLFIPSHRAEFSYQPLTTMPMTGLRAQDAFDRTVGAYRNRTFGHGGPSAYYYLKEALIGFAVFGFGNQVVQADSSKRELFTGFERILSKILPPNLGFSRLSVRPPDVVLETSSGDFMIDAVSGGVGALIDLAWQVFMFQATSAGEYTVVVDEVENHLHPSMQRLVLPNLLEAFPRAQFIVATHSPFVVGSVPDSNVYALKYNEHNAVVSEHLDLVNRAGPASEILREVLGVPSTIPVWAEVAIKNAIREAEESGLPPADALEKLRTELDAAGLSGLVPGALARFGAKGMSRD